MAGNMQLNDGFGVIDEAAGVAHAELAEKNQFEPPPVPASPGANGAVRQYQQHDYLGAKERMGRDGLAVASGREATERFELYTADQYLFNNETKRRLGRRSENLFPALLSWLNAKFGNVHHLYVHDNYAWHEAVLAVLSTMAITALRSVPRFVWAHMPLYVSPRAYRRHRLQCKGCTFRSVKHGTAFCDAVKDAKLCTCPQTPAWPLASLGYMLALASFGCPLGKFGRGRVWLRRLVVLAGAGAAAWYLL